MTQVRITTLIRRNEVFERVVRGETYAEICAAMQISEDTIARDLKAISDDVKALARERLGVVVALALEHYQFVIDEARANYLGDSERLDRWYDGDLDYDAENVSTKTLALEGDADGESAGPQGKAAAAAYHDLALQHESQPLEVKRTRRRVRPALVGERAVWLRLMLEATREFCELLGVKKLVVEVSGPDGGPIEVSDARQRLLERLARRAADAEEDGAVGDPGGPG